MEKEGYTEREMTPSVSLTQRESADDGYGIWNREKTVSYIQERLKRLDQAEICALFLISAGRDSRENEEENSCARQQILRHMAGILSRFFKASDIVGYYGEGRFAVFLSGQLTEKKIREKADMLNEVLRITSEESEETKLSNHIGIYIFDNSQAESGTVFKETEEALETAERAGTNLYIKDEVKDMASESGEKDELQVHSKGPDENKEWLKMVLKQTDHQLWEVDLEKRIFSMVNLSSQPYEKQTVYENFPDSVIESGVIHPDSAVRFRRFAEGMFGGRAEDTENFIIQYRRSNCYGWASMSYHTIYDAEGHPIKALGIKSELSYRTAGQSGIIRRMPVPENLYPHLFGSLQANLTTDMIEKLQFEGREQIWLASYRSYSEVMQMGIGRMFSRDDEQELTQQLDRQTLLDAYKQGRQWLAVRCRIVDRKGDIRQILAGGHLSMDPESEDICLFVYFSDMEERWIWENAVNSKIGRDPVTRLYDAVTQKRLADYLIHTKKDTLCALALIEIGGYEILLENDSEKTAWKRCDIEMALAVSLDTDCVAGMVEENRMAVFFPDAGSRYSLRRRLENALTYVRLSFNMTEMMSIRFVSGVVCEEIEKADFGMMLNQAAALCGMYGNEASDRVIFANEIQDQQGSSTVLLDKDEEGISLRTLMPDPVMTELEKDTVLVCITSMLRSDSLALSVGAVLRCIGMYYQADRVYILTLSDHGRSLSVFHEWTREGRHSIKQIISGKRLENFPLLQRNVKNLSPIFLSKKKNGQEPEEKGTAWQFAMFPMERGTKQERVLCMENPRVHSERTALVDYLLPRIQGEWKRFSQDTKRALSANGLSSLQNLQSYMDMVYSLTSDMYSSMGVLAIDIPNLSTLHIRRGYEYGSRFILRISEILTDVFGKAFLFHTREAEFVVLCVNTTFTVFEERCTRVQMLLENGYSGQFRLGRTWSDGVFAAKNLVQEARSMMFCDNSRTASGNEQFGSGILERDLVSGGQFTVYLQPKIDMRTGAAVGAEALARVFGENGQVILPGSIIDKMEQDGTIHEMDYFVLDRTLSLLSEWKSKGYDLIPVSTNFSRNTLMSPSALASALAILSRYPEIPPELIEFEITETAGNIEKSVLSGIIERFREFGLRFALDDFGSNYSNIAVFTNIKFDTIKLDRSLIKELTGNNVGKMLVRDIVQICKSCGMMCIAEGVENQNQVTALLREGCIYCQGYYYDRPMASGEFEQKYLRLQKIEQEEEEI